MNVSSRRPTPIKSSSFGRVFGVVGTSAQEPVGEQEGV